MTLQKEEGLVRVCAYLNNNDWQRFKNLVFAEGKNASQTLRQFIRAYNQEHDPGNPQLKMLFYVQPETRQPMRVLCNHLGGAMNNGQVFCRRAHLWIPGVRCYSCKFNRLLKKRKKKV